MLLNVCSTEKSLVVAHSHVNPQKIGGIFQLLDLLIFIVWTFWLGAQLGRVKDLRYSEQKDLLDTDASAGDSSAANNL